MRFLNQRPFWADYLLILAGTGLLAVGIQCLYDPIGLVTGGFTGIAIIVRRLSIAVTEDGIPLWFTNLMLNIPVFLIAWRVKGRRFIGKTAAATFLLSAWLYVIPTINLSQGDFILAAVFGGVVSGAGMGCVLLAKATTGGTDMVAVLLHHKLRHYSVIQILQFLDALIVLGGLYAFGWKTGLYAIAAIYIASKVSDALMEGMKYSKAAFVITDRYEQVARALMEKLDRGVTALNAKGMYSGEEKWMLYCVVSKKEIVELKDIVVGIDKNAFVIVSDAREVLGEGFIEAYRA